VTTKVKCKLLPKIGYFIISVYGQFIGDNS